jgi:hypothetical protein
LECNGFQDEYWYDRILCGLERDTGKVLLDKDKAISRSASFPISACLFELNFRINMIKKINGQVLSINKTMKNI